MKRYEKILENIEPYYMSGNDNLGYVSMQTLKEFCKESAWQAWKRATIDWYKNRNTPYDRGEKLTFEEWWNEEITEENHVHNC
jgi:hypothetical protein